ncbi:MAG: hypothetical protein AAFW65_01025 [Pseudomonadota bacterium]
MSREVDDRKKRKALRKLRKAAELAEAGLGPPLSDWEREFLEEVEQRIETYGSAFADPTKGALEEPLSALQNQKLKEIDKKARGKGSSGFKPRKGLSSKKKPAYTPRGRDINEDVEADAGEIAAPEPPAPPAEPQAPRLVASGDAPKPAPRPNGPPKLRVIDGGGGEQSS